MTTISSHIRQTNTSYNYLHSYLTRLPSQPIYFTGMDNQSRSGTQRHDSAVNNLVSYFEKKTGF